MMVTTTTTTTTTTTAWRHHHHHRKHQRGTQRKHEHTNNERSMHDDQTYRTTVFVASSTALSPAEFSITRSRRYLKYVRTYTQPRRHMHHRVRFHHDVHSAAHPPTHTHTHAHTARQTHPLNQATTFKTYNKPATEICTRDRPLSFRRTIVQPFMRKRIMSTRPAEAKDVMYAPTQYLLHAQSRRATMHARAGTGARVCMRMCIQRASM